MNATADSIQTDLAAYLADRLGETRATIADIKAEEKALKDRLVQLGESPVEGEMFRVTIAETVSYRIDTKKIRTYAPKWLLDKVTMPVTSTTVRCTARKTT